MVLWITVRRRKSECLDRISFNYHSYPHATNLLGSVTGFCDNLSGSDLHFLDKSAHTGVPSDLETSDVALTTLGRLSSSACPSGVAVWSAYSMLKLETEQGSLVLMYMAM